MHIVVKFSEAGLFGGDDLSATDIGASAKKFTAMVRDAIQAEYPEADIDVSYDIDDSNVVDGDPSSHESEDVGYIVSQVWLGFGWVVDKTEPNPEAEEAERRANERDLYERGVLR
jgi:hypothetical protein